MDNRPSRSTDPSVTSLSAHTRMLMRKFGFIEEIADTIIEQMLIPVTCRALKAIAMNTFSLSGLA